MILTYRQKDGEPFYFSPPVDIDEWDTLAKKIDPITLALVTFTPPITINGNAVLRVTSWSRMKLQQAARGLPRELFAEVSRDVAIIFFGDRPLHSPLGLLVHRCHELSSSQSWGDNQ